MGGNLKKTQGMDVGQVGFHKEKDVKKLRIEKRINAIVNRLEKTKIEKTIDFRLERETRDKEEREKAKAEQKKEKQAEKEKQKEREKQAEVRSYRSLMVDADMKSNKD